MSAYATDIPSDILPICDPTFAHLRLAQKQFFVNRFFSTRTHTHTRKINDATNPVYSINPTSAFSASFASTSSMSTSLESTPSASTSGLRLPMATRRARSNTADSTASVESFVSQGSAGRISSAGDFESKRICGLGREASRSTRERGSVVEDGWVPVERYF